MAWTEAKKLFKQFKGGDLQKDDQWWFIMKSPLAMSERSYAQNTGK